ncbi:MAG: HlyD family efflux transporter periplasmic adaptor subunit [Hyphomicrobiaceae bacterium]|nr:HlyD family efflux transporter periplasmic adaptor subunit [Hyphomicrobiaceae bacterium]
MKKTVLNTSKNNSSGIVKDGNSNEKNTYSTDINYRNKIDHEFTTTRSWLPSMSILLFLGLVVFILWSSIFEIDQAVRSRGQIIPSAKTQIIQVADGGVLAKLHVQEGQHVKEGEILAVLEKERANANYEQNLVKVMSFNAGLIRAKAELSGIDPKFTEEFSKFNEFVIAEKNYYYQRKQGLDDELKSINSNLSIALEELQINESLYNEGDVSRIEVMRSQREVAELEGQITTARNRYLQKAQEDVTRLEAELAASRYQLEERKSVLDHTDLTSPVAGIVKYLKVNTLGGVLRAGDELMQISPTEDEFIIEAKINPVDIGQLHSGLSVYISLDAFDYAIYGGLHGTLIYISADTLTESQGDQSHSYYRAHIRVNDDARSINPKLADVILKPGMSATANIVTGKRTVLQYLLKPIFRGFSGAMIER